MLKKTVILRHQYEDRSEKIDYEETLQKVKPENTCAKDGRRNYTNKNKNCGGRFI
jgi:hypothetical protein